MALNEWCYQEAKRRLTRDRASIEKIFPILMEKETLLRPDWEKLVAANPPQKDPEAADASKEAAPAAPAPETTDGGTTPPTDK
jgi:hypothetical protein